MDVLLKEVFEDDFWIMPQTPQYLESGVPYITSKNIKKGKIDFGNVNYISEEDYQTISKNRPIKEGDILISMIGTLGEIAVVKLEDGKFYGQNMFLIRLNKEKVYDRYFLNYFNSNKVKRDLERSQNQSTQRYLKANHIEDLMIPLPSLDEQRFIAKILDSLSDIIKKRHKELEELDNLIKSRYVELFGNPLDPYKVNYIFTECVEFNPKKSEVKDLQDVEVSFVPMECVGVDGSFTIKGTGLISDYYSGYTYFRDGDVLLAKITPCFENGKVAIAIDCKNGIGFGTTEFHVSRPLKGITNSVWVKYLLKNDMVHDLATINMSGSAGQKRIQTPFFNKLKVYVPPIEEQEQFADFVHQVTKLKFEVQKSLDETQTLMDSLMQQYFG